MTDEWNPIEYLNGLHTRQLMDLRNDCYKFQHDVCLVEGSDHYVSLDSIKEILATREHIPNKQEAKDIRRQKAKNQRNR